MKVSLAKALKLKNRKVRLITEIQKKISTSNSRLAAAQTEFNARELYEKLQLVQEELVQLKTAINNANLPIQETIYRMAELKGRVTFIKSLPTHRGKVLMSYQATELQEYKAEITAPEVAEEVEKLERQIDELQDRLDRHNATVDIDVDMSE